MLLSLQLLKLELGRRKERVRRSRLEAVVEVVGEEGTAGAIWGEELCDMLTGRGCMGLADNIVDDELGCLTTVSDVCTTSEEVMGRRGKRREQERQIFCW